MVVGYENGSNGQFDVLSGFLTKIAGPSLSPFATGLDLRPLDDCRDQSDVPCLLQHVAVEAVAIVQFDERFTDRRDILSACAMVVAKLSWTTMMSFTP